MVERQSVTSPILDPWITRSSFIIKGINYLTVESTISLTANSRYDMWEYSQPTHRVQSWSYARQLMILAIDRSCQLYLHEKGTGGSLCNKTIKSVHILRNGLLAYCSGESPATLFACPSEAVPSLKLGYQKVSLHLGT